MVTVYLVQHGKAKSKDEDPERPLTGQGEKETKKIAAMASQLGLAVGEIRHSGKTRAEETAVIFGRTLGLLGDVKPVDGLHPTDDVEPVVDSLEHETNNVMLVGHLPFMARLAGHLVNGDIEESPVKFRNSGIVCLAQKEDGWDIEWQLNPG